MSSFLNFTLSVLTAVVDCQHEQAFILDIIIGAGKWVHQCYLEDSPDTWICAPLLIDRWTIAGWTSIPFRFPPRPLKYWKHLRWGEGLLEGQNPVSSCENRVRCSQSNVLVIRFKQTRWLPRATWLLMKKSEPETESSIQVWFFRTLGIQFCVVHHGMLFLSCFTISNLSRSV